MDNPNITELHEHEHHPNRRLNRIIFSLKEVMEISLHYESFYFNDLPDVHGIKCYVGNKMTAATGRSHIQCKMSAAMMMLRKLGFTKPAKYLGEEQQEIIKKKYLHDKWGGVENPPEIDINVVDMTHIHDVIGDSVTRLEKIVQEIRKGDFPTFVQYIYRHIDYSPQDKYVECIVDGQSTCGIGVNYAIAQKSAADAMLLKLGFKTNKCFVGPEVQKLLMKKYKRCEKVSKARRCLFPSEDGPSGLSQDR